MAYALLLSFEARSARSDDTSYLTCRVDIVRDEPSEYNTDIPYTHLASDYQAKDSTERGLYFVGLKAQAHHRHDGCRSFYAWDELRFQGWGDRLTERNVADAAKQYARIRRALDKLLGDRNIDPLAT